ncbi:12303_t:CDS:2 [Entrophospora sp. SA101]|nr:12303_t:CDS:2 [Entrophospora sp. SA101]
MTLDFKDEYFENKIVQIKNCRGTFRSIANDTVVQSDNLVGFGGDIMVLLKDYSDKEVPNEDILGLLDKLLNDAKTNVIAIENTNFKIKTLEDDMKKIHDELLKFGKKVDPTIYNNLKDAESKKKLLDIVTTAAFTIGGIGKEVAILREPVQMTDKSKTLKNNVFSIITFLNELKGFWEKHIVELERLIETLKSLSENNRPHPNRSIIKCLENRWKKTIKECKHYSNVTRYELDPTVEPYPHFAKDKPAIMRAYKATDISKIYEELEAEFDKIDTKHGGYILFEEYGIK